MTRMVPELASDAWLPPANTLSRTGPPPVLAPAFGVRQPPDARFATELFGRRGLLFSVLRVLLAVLGLATGIRAADTVPPPVPGNLRIAQLGPTPNRVALQWNTVTDTGGSGLKEYVVYRDGLEVVRNTSAIGVDPYLLAGHTYSFRVAALDNDGNQSSLSTALVVTALPPSPIAGTKSLKALLLRFPDWPDEPYDTNYANDVLFNGPFSVKKFFEENSYGRLTFQGDSEGWYTLPKVASNYCSFTLNGGLWYGCNTSQMLNDALSVIPNSSRIGTNDVVVLLIHGMGTVGLSGGKYKYIAATNGFIVDVVAHEIGHDFNATMHAAGQDVCSTYPVPPDLLRLTDSPCFLGRYTDGYDTMAAGNSYHFNMFIKEKMGFLLPSNIQTVTNDGDYVLHMAELPTNEVQMIKIPLPHEMFYFLEYRTRTGFDGPGTPSPGGAPGPIDGVLLHLRPSRFPGSDADTVRPRIVLNPGTPFIDPYRPLLVEVTQTLTNRVVVRISGLNHPLRLQDLQRSGAGGQDARVIFDTIAGGRYSVQATTDFLTWQTLRTNILAAGLSTTNTLPGAGTNSRSFFRVGVHPLP